VDEARGHEAAFLVEDERDAPGTLGDRALAGAALGPPRFVALRAVDARQSLALDTAPGVGPQPFGVVDGRRRRLQRLQEGFRAPERAAVQVEPVRGVAFAEGVRHGLAEAQHSGGDGLTAATALRPARRGGL